MFTRLLLVPFLLVTAIFLYLALRVDPAYARFIPWPVVAMAGLYVFSPKINWWWYTRYPPDLDAGLRKLVEQAPGFYHRLSATEQLRFRQRVSLFIMGNDFKAQGIKAVPNDVEAVVAASAVTLMFGQKFLVFPKYEHIVIYPHPFPSPQYPERFHISEVYDEDGVLLFSMKHLMHGFFQPDQYFHIGLYEYARVYVRSNAFTRLPQVDETHWPVLERISGFGREAIEKYINLTDIDPLAVAIAHFFVFPEAFEREWPDAFEKMQATFRAPGL
ncbi:MAG: zinc-dependent peptidase [Saprospiraceae bacterium]|nr:zinc-dependent peptidase [Saprospiraceae bacterium]